MKALICALASTRLTLVGMLLLGVGAAVNYDNPVDTSIWVLVAPLVLLALNLSVAIVTNPRIHRRGGLLVFHLGLLGLLLLAAIGRLTYMDARLEIVAGKPFEMADLMDVKQGLWHFGALDQVQFIQGPYQVDYEAGLIRGQTRSTVYIPNEDQETTAQVVGDDTPLVLHGYRFYTTFNKGFAPILTWQPDHGEAVTGTVHMPSYPLFEYKQDIQWQPPGSATPIRFWLRVSSGISHERAWTFDPAQAQGVLVVKTRGQRVELPPGGEVQLEGGTLRFERLSSWMGYRLFYDPTIHGMFIMGMLAVGGLGVHFWKKFGTPMSVGARTLQEHVRPLL